MTEAERHLGLWQSRLRDPTFVYVLRCGAPIKVGFARDVKQRMVELQCGNPVELELLHVLTGDQRLEWFLHQKLKGARLRGEWFDGPAVAPFLDYVADLADQMLTAWDGTDKAPDYLAFDPDLQPDRPNPITVRHVEPDPKTPPDEARRLRMWYRHGLDVGPLDEVRRKRAPRS